jgi:hypothetical protein
MRGLANYFLQTPNSQLLTNPIDVEKWGILGLLHDGDYEMTKETRERHTLQMIEWLDDLGETDEELIKALKSHNYAHTGHNPPDTLMEWSLFCCDELTGFIVAVALVRPDKKLSSVDVDSVIKKFGNKEFAKAVNRVDIYMCEEKLGIPLREFVEITRSAMQGIASEIGL